MTIKDQYPASGKDVSTSVVDVNAVLGSMKHELLETGAWLNIIGYVRPLPEAISNRAGTKTKLPNQTVIFVEAVIVWSAGAIKVDPYNAALTEFQNSCQTGTNLAR